jgi:hypothetical protein
MPTVSRDGRYYWDGTGWVPFAGADQSQAGQGRWLPWLSLLVVIAAVSFAAGLFIGLPLGRTPTPSQQVVAYDKTRQANIAPLEQALANVNSDCAVGDAGRCSLSLAYVLALDQKFLDELGQTDVPNCAISSDQQLRVGLRRLQQSVSDAIAAGGPPPPILPGVSDIEASNLLYAATTCP